MFERTWGKLVKPVSVSFDEERYLEQQKAKDLGFEFNDWARKIFLENWQDVQSYIRKKSP